MLLSALPHDVLFLVVRHLLFEDVRSAARLIATCCCRALQAHALHVREVVWWRRETPWWERQLAAWCRPAEGDPSAARRTLLKVRHANCDQQAWIAGRALPTEPVGSCGFRVTLEALHGDGAIQMVVGAATFSCTLACGIDLASGRVMRFRCPACTARLCDPGRLRALPPRGDDVARMPALVGGVGTAIDVDVSTEALVITIAGRTTVTMLLNEAFPVDVAPPGPHPWRPPSWFRPWVQLRRVGDRVRLHAK